jgi:hypothetical protein
VFSSRSCFPRAWDASRRRRSDSSLAAARCPVRLGAGGALLERVDGGAEVVLRVEPGAGDPGGCGDADDGGGGSAAGGGVNGEDGAVTGLLVPLPGYSAR